MNKILTVLTILPFMISCQNKQEQEEDDLKELQKQPIEFNEKIVDFVIENSNDKFIELPNLYDSLPKEMVPNDKDEKLILVQILKRKGFEITNWERGNHPLGPRIVVFNLKKDRCECEVQKIYYSTDALPEEIYKTTERIKCKKEPKTK